MPQKVVVPGQLGEVRAWGGILTDAGTEVLDGGLELRVLGLSFLEQVAEVWVLHDAPDRHDAVLVDGDFV